MRKELIDQLKNITGVSFVSVTYVNQQNEKHQTVFNVGVDYQKAKAKDIEYLSNLDVTTLNSSLDIELLEAARVELLNSFIAPSKNRSEGINSAYTHVGKGLKIHNESETLFVYGMKISKRVIQEGDKKEDTRRPLTVAKDKIRSLLKSTQYRQFEIGRASQFKIKGDTIIFE
jgi:hypothetical protein